MSEATREERQSRVVFGLMLVTVGALAWMVQIGVVEVDHVWQFWPLLVIAHGLRRLLGGYWARGVVVIGIGIVLQLDVLDYLEIGATWPLMLIALGVAMCLDELGRLGDRGRDSHRSSEERDHG